MWQDWCVMELKTPHAPGPELPCGSFACAGILALGVPAPSLAPGVRDIG